MAERAYLAFALRAGIIDEPVRAVLRQAAKAEGSTMTTLSQEQTTPLVDAVDASMDLADRLFRDLAARTADSEGVTRASYGEGEQIGHDLLTDAARPLGFEVTTDLAGNTYVTLPGKNRDAPRVITGSHLDRHARGTTAAPRFGSVAALWRDRCSRQRAAHNRRPVVYLQSYSKPPRL